MNEGIWVFLGAVVGGGVSILTTIVTQRHMMQRESVAREVSALYDLQNALQDWYMSFLTPSANSGGRSLAPDSSKGMYPELRILMLAQRVRDPRVREAIDGLLNQEAEVVSEDALRLGPDENRERLALLMQRWPSVRRLIGDRLRKLE